MVEPEHTFYQTHRIRERHATPEAGVLDYLFVPEPSDDQLRDALADAVSQDGEHAERLAVPGNESIGWPVKDRITE